MTKSVPPGIQAEAGGDLQRIAVRHLPFCPQINGAAEDAGGLPGLFLFVPAFSIMVLALALKGRISSGRRRKY